MTGIGVPQYLCLEMTQSRSLYCVFSLPPTNSVIARFDFSESVLSNFPEFMSLPPPVYAVSDPVYCCQKYLKTSAVTYCATRSFSTHAGTCWERSASATSFWRLPESSNTRQRNLA